MKMRLKNQYSYLFYLLLLPLLMMYACAEEDLGGFTPKDPVLVFGSSDTFEVGKETGDYKLFMEANLPWRVRTDVDWITIDNEQGLESDTIKFSVAKNNATVTRTGKLIAWILKNEEHIIYITQEAGDPLPDIANDYYVKVNGDPENDGLSWETATSLDNALALAATKDKIHLAAGTYLPTVVVTGGNESDAGDLTFEITKNINLIGAYPENPVAGDQPDPVANTTSLSGSMGSQNAYHVITITAPLEEDLSVSFKNINITGGKSAPNGTPNLNINGINYPRLNGGAGCIGRANVKFEDCRIHDNKADHHTPGFYIFSGATVSFINSSLDKNTGTSASGANGGAIWNDGSTVYFINAAVSSNSNSGVGGGIYAFNAAVPSKTYMFNTTIDNNSGAHKTAYYGRENSIGLMINCTVYGNSSTNGTNSGAGINLYANTTTARLDMISCTVTGNVSNGSGDVAAGIRVNDANCTLNIYNSIISGNIGNNQVGDIYAPAGISYATAYSVISSDVYDEDGTKVPSKTFDFTSMLTPFADNGGLGKTCLLTGTDNPAETLGMNSSQLSLLGLNLEPIVGDEVITFDQLGLTREGLQKMGASVK